MKVLAYQCSTRQALLIGFVGGASAIFGFEPFGLYPLVPLALGLLLVLWQGAASTRSAFHQGYAWGLGYFLAGVSWVYVSMHDVGGMAAPLAAMATLLFAGWLALFPALAGYFWAKLRSGSPLCDALLFAGLWTLSELARGYLFSGFPWLSVGYSQTPPSPLAGYAPWLGVYGIGFMVALAAALVIALPAPARRGSAAIGLVLVLGGGFVASEKDWTHPTGNPMTLTLLQGNIPQELKWDPKSLALSIDTYTRLAAASPPGPVILPETAIPLLFDHIPRETLDALARNGQVILGGAIGTDGDRYVNAAVALRPGENPGQFRAQLYAKRHLVPFGEFIPPGFDWFFKLVNIPMTGFAVGPAHQTPLLVDDQSLWPTICYEDLFGEEMVDGVADSTILLNLSNTAWFGHSLAQPQHLQIARLRTLETGRPMVRATNTGMTAAISAEGKVLAALPAFSEGALTVTVQGMSGLTPYLRIGNGGALFLALLALVPALVLRRRVAKSTTITSRSPS